ncbi:MAG: hypothetical protein ACKVTZ_08330 [Bacteroidia bacterium]
MQLQRFIIGICLLFCTIFLQNAFAQGVVLTDFKVSSIGSDLKIDWTIQSETGVSEFRLYRKVGTDTEYRYVKTIPATGVLKYSYLDDNVFKTEDATVVSYELRVIKNSTPHYFYTSMAHTTSSVQRTWGSIKSMFK